MSFELLRSINEKLEKLTKIERDKQEAKEEKVRQINSMNLIVKEIEKSAEDNFRLTVETENKPELIVWNFDIYSRKITLTSDEVLEGYRQNPANTFNVHIGELILKKMDDLIAEA